MTHIAEPLATRALTAEATNDLVNDLENTAQQALDYARRAIGELGLIASQFLDEPEPGDRARAWDALRRVEGEAETAAADLYLITDPEQRAAMRGLLADPAADWSVTVPLPPHANLSVGGVKVSFATQDGEWVVTSRRQSGGWTNVRHRVLRVALDRVALLPYRDPWPEATERAILAGLTR